MKTDTEIALRTILSTDETVGEELVQRALGYLRGDRDGEADDGGELKPVVMRHNEVTACLGVSRRDLGYLLKRGYMTRVYASATDKRALGISRESVMRFKARRLERKRT